MLQAAWRWSKCIEDEILNYIPDRDSKIIIHVPSGFSGIGNARIDRYFDASQKVFKDNRISGLPNIKADMSILPIKSGCADYVISDPPYDQKRNMKGLPMLLEECARVLKPKGKLILLSPWILKHDVFELKDVWLHPSGGKSFPAYKILSIHIKRNDQIGDYV